MRSSNIQPSPEGGILWPSNAAHRRHIRRRCARPINALHTGVAQKFIILRRNDAACDDLDVAAALLRADPSISSGMSVLCPAASVDAPTTSTSLSSARTTVSSGVWNSGPLTTSKPISPKAEEMTLAPRSCPSCPILATSNLGLRPKTAFDGLHAVDHLRPAFVEFIGRCRKCPAPASASCHSGRTQPPSRRKFRRMSRAHALHRRREPGDCHPPLRLRSTP